MSVCSPGCICCLLYMSICSPGCICCLLYMSVCSPCLLRRTVPTSRSHRRSHPALLDFSPGGKGAEKRRNQRLGGGGDGSGGGGHGGGSGHGGGGSGRGRNIALTPEPVTRGLTEVSLYDPSSRAGPGRESADPYTVIDEQEKTILDCKETIVSDAVTPVLQPCLPPRSHSKGLPAACLLNGICPPQFHPTMQRVFPLTYYPNPFVQSRGASGYSADQSGQARAAGCAKRPQNRCAQGREAEIATRIRHSFTTNHTCTAHHDCSNTPHATEAPHISQPSPSVITTTTTPPP